MRPTGREWFMSASLTRRQTVLDLVFGARPRGNRHQIVRFVLRCPAPFLLLRRPRHPDRRHRLCRAALSPLLSTGSPRLSAPSYPHTGYHFVSCRTRRSGRGFAGRGRIRGCTPSCCRHGCRAAAGPGCGYPDIFPHMGRRRVCVVLASDARRHELSAPRVHPLMPWDSKGALRLCIRIQARRRTGARQT